jgi:RNA polymerase sigma-70 factor (ECF subfamily)
MDELAPALATALEEVIWSVPPQDLGPADAAIRCLLTAAGVGPAAALAELSDEALAVAVQRNFLRKLAFEELLVNRYEKPLQRWLLGRTGRRELAQDLTQDLYLKLLTGNTLDNYNPDYPFPPWLWAVVRHLWINEWRRRRKYEQAAPAEEEDPRPQPPEEAAGRELEERVELAVRALPEDQQRAFREALGGADAEHIARAVGVSKQRAYQLLFRARRQVERLLRGPAPGRKLPNDRPPFSPPVLSERSLLG